MINISQMKKWWKKIRWKLKRERVMGRRQLRERLQSKMLFRMQYSHGIERIFNEFNNIFETYPKLRLTRWVVFRAWYKHNIDFMFERPDIYGLKLKGGMPYSKEADPLYDPNAPDWEQYDRPQYYDDDDSDEDEDDDYDYDYDDDDSLKKSMEDGLSMGIGIGIGAGLSGGDGCPS